MNPAGEYQIPRHWEAWHHFSTSVDYLLGRTDDPSPRATDYPFDPGDPDWYDKGPQWLRNDDPDFRPCQEREDIRRVRVLLDPDNRVFFRMKTKVDEKTKKQIRLDILQFTAWRLDQEKE